jgi:uncharacterized tellurite resistance protein B-like protein
MIDAIARFVRERIRPESAPAAGADEQRLRLAAAALLVEVARADFDVKEAERRTILHLLETELHVGAAEAAELARVAEEQARAAVSIYGFTRLLDQELSRAEKVRVVELLWRVALADGELEKHEEQLVRKVADLLHVEHRDFIAAKQRARDARPRAG